MDHTEVLPDDALANILGRLPWRNLAASRCVRKAWRAVVDAHGLLLPHVLPHMVRGIFLSRKGHDRPISFFARPSAQQPMVDGRLDFLPRYGGVSRQIVDHCNGLLLCPDFRTLCVVNPITRRWDELPWEEDEYCNAYLVFDPAASLHYEVFSIPHELEKVVMNPPSLWTLNVFSSSTEQWYKRSFVHEANALLTNVQQDPMDRRSMSGGTCCSASSVYWRGSLYVNHGGLFVVRLSLSDGKYRVIKMPIDIVECKRERPYVERSEKGLYFATINDDAYRLRVWVLMESGERLEWVLKHHIDLMACAATLKLSRLHSLVGVSKAWILVGGEDGNNGALMDDNLDWDSDDDNVVNIPDTSYHGFYDYISFLGFHPYKEVVFLGFAYSSRGVGVAYHLNTSKIQYLGRLDPKDYSRGVYYPYTPCMIEHLLKHSSGS